jgi:hypothetical protein
MPVIRAANTAKIATTIPIIVPTDKLLLVVQSSIKAHNGVMMFKKINNSDFLKLEETIVFFFF